MLQILLATYNGGKYLEEQLQSLFAQSIQDFEIIARDDGSTDNTVAILTQYAAKYPNRLRFTVNHPPTGNAKDNFFLLMQDATADYMMFCDQDDVWLPNKIEKTMAAMQTLPQDRPALVHTDLSVVNADLQITNQSFYRMQHFERAMRITLPKALAQNTVTGCTVMINRALCDTAKNTNHKDIIMHDWWLAVLAAAFGSVKAVKMPTMLYRQHGNNSVGAKKFAAHFRREKQQEKSLQQSLVLSFNQAAHFACVFGNRLSPRMKQAVEIFANIAPAHQLQRLWNIARYGFWKQSFPHKVAQILITVLPGMRLFFK